MTQPDLSVNWQSQSAEDVLRRLETQIEAGLTSSEAAQRLEQYGPNQLAEKPRPSFFRLVLAQLNNFVIILLIVAALISALLGEWVDAGAILAIVILNSVLGVVQESRAEEALAALKKMAAPEAHILRDGSRITVPSRDLVPGDIVFLEAGNFIPADLRLLEAINLRIEEAALTGESIAIQKNASSIIPPDAPLGDRINTAFMGTTVSYGRGNGVVVSTGMHTQLGLIADMLQTVDQEATPLQKRLDQLGKILGWGALIVCALVFLIGILRAVINSSFSIERLVELFMIAVSLAIAAVPEGLPAVVTISLALGMREMVRRHALIRKLASVETLGSATVICSDKTGTLTQNAMTVTQLWVNGNHFEISGGGYVPEGDFRIEGRKVDLQDYPAALTALWIGTLNNDAKIEQFEGEDGKPTYRIIGDPTEGSILVAAAKAGVLQADLVESYPRAQEIPFDSDRKRMVTIHAIQHMDPADSSPIYNDGQRSWHAVAVKGAPDVVLRLCSSYQKMDDRSSAPLDDEVRQRILAANDRMTQSALRVLGLAYRLVPVLPQEMTSEELENDLIFAGLVGMIDPARPEVQPALEKARAAGIRTIMITGDYPNTARAIAESIHLLRPNHRVMTGAEAGALDEQALIAAVKETDVFARVSPEHKMRIVDALRANDEVVAMTGDGVNDAPAIKRADIGVAMGITGTDVAKETADMVLTDDNYASIVSAIEQGRVIYNNIRKFVFFLLSSNVAEIMIIFIPTLAGLPIPLTAIQLLSLNLITDGAPALALAMEKGDPDVMRVPPRPKKESILNGPIQIGILIQTITQTLSTLTAFVLGLIWSAQAAGAEIGASWLSFLFSFNWQSLDISTAETMAFATLSLCEIFRAYTVRSERVSLFSLGVFSNRYMQYAVGFSFVMLMLICFVPGLQTVFNTTFLTLTEWAVIFCLAVIPALVEEITKFFLRLRQPIQSLA
jgi:P-type Ca2+ transporter type 2C